MLPELQELISSDGNVRLAAERLHISPHELMKRVIAVDKEEFLDALRLTVSLQILDVVSNYKVALIAAVGEMPAKDLAKSFIELLDSFGSVMALEEPKVPQQGGSNVHLLQVFDGDASAAREKLISRLSALPALPVGNES